MGDKLDKCGLADDEYSNGDGILKAGINFIADTIEFKSKGKLLGVETGIQAIDKRTGGIQPSELWILCARPSIGKTAMALQWIINAGRQEVPIGNCSLEMTEQQIFIRSMAHYYKLNGTALKLGDDREVLNMRKCLDIDSGTSRELSKFPIYTDVNTTNFAGIESRITYWARKYGIKAVVIDHVGYIDDMPRFKGNKNNEIGFITKRLKNLAKRLNIGIVLISQFNRDMEKQKRKPVQADLRDSGSLEQDANVIIALHSEDYTDNPRKEISLGFLKNRDGVRGWLGERFILDGPTQTFINCIKKILMNQLL